MSLKALAFVLISLSTFSAGAAASLTGKSLLGGSGRAGRGGDTVKLNFPQPKKTVLIFMSAQCPCSESHEGIVKDLAERFKELQFFVVHSNANETLAEAKAHFTKADMKVSIIRDEKTVWADRFGALKTPHAFILDEAGEVIYRGGVTDSHVGSLAKTKFLEEVLTDLAAGKKPRRSEGRALGCYIQRGDT